MKKRSLVLITRPVDDGRRFADELARSVIEPLLQPMMEIVSLGFIPPDLSRYQAMLVSSANALRVFCAKVSARDMRMYVVGKNTQEEARTQGFPDVISADGTADDLMDSVVARAEKDGLPLLHVRGEDVAKPLDEMLRVQGFKVENLIVYKARFVGGFSTEVLKKISDGSVNIVTFFSRRTADNFMRLVDENELGGALGGIKALCISSDVLECVRLHSWADTYTAKTSDRAGMLALIQGVCAGDE